MSHSHHHDHAGIQPLARLNAAYYIAIALNLGFVVLEVVVGLTHNSLGLLSDAGHKMLDVLTLVIALVAFKLASSKPGKRFTYGYRKTSVLISLFNAAMLLVAVCVIIWESVEKFRDMTPTDGAAISWTAGVGIIASGASAILLGRHQRGDINTRGAFLHMATDSLLSLGVVISGIVISCTGWHVIDPIISIVIALVILLNTGKLLLQSFRMSIDAVPESVDFDVVMNAILASDGVLGARDLHIWPVSITETAVTAVVKVADMARASESIASVHCSLEALGIARITIEPESAD